jgi:hypothetical protein
MKRIPGILLALLLAIAPLAASADGISIPNVPSVPIPDFGATFTNSGFLAQLGTFRAHLQQLQNMQTDLKSAAGSWSSLQADMAKLQALMAAKTQADAMKTASAQQRADLAADYGHIQQLTQLSDMTSGRNEKLDVANKMLEAMIAEQMKARQLELAKQQAQQAKEDALKKAFMGTSGTGVYNTP